jgi:protoporphyrinogen oxidase
MTITILGAGIAGLSCSFHLGHENCVLFEKNSYPGGHIATHEREGSLWDEGPHVSFTKHNKARELLTKSSKGDLLDIYALVGNWYKGNWIPHPAQANLHAVPKPLAEQCLEDFLSSRPTEGEVPRKEPANYAEWLEISFGTRFAQTFPASYTRKYWTCEPEDLTTDWVGERVFAPDVDTVKNGYHRPPANSTHYITNMRYPKHGGFVSFADGLIEGSNIKFGHELISIDMKSKQLYFANGARHTFDKLINTLPLDLFIGLIIDAPQEIADACSDLHCSSMLLVNILSRGMPTQPYHWLYVYDEDMYSTRITQTSLLSPNNTPSGYNGIQVEVYESRYRPFSVSHPEIADIVLKEAASMGLIGEHPSVHTQYIKYSNVICTHSRREALDKVFSWLQQYGLEREPDDLEPMTDWAAKTPLATSPELSLAGRFAQWKYFWTDDCLLRGEYLAGSP